MENIVKNKNEEVLNLVNDTSLFPILEESTIGTPHYKKFPIERLSSLGVAFQPISSALQTAISGSGGSGLYYVNTSGKTMHQMTGSKNFIGSLKSATGSVGGGQAQMVPFACDPTMLFMAATLATIEKKLDEIKELQQEMMDFLIQKEKSELKGNLTFLYDIFNNYKYNWNNDMYKKNNHIKVLDIKQAAERQIDFCCKQIASKVNKKSFFHSDQLVNKQLASVEDQFKDYQLSLYLLAFSSFLEILLLENYNADYLSDLSKKLDNYSIKYRELYTTCHVEIEKYSSSSLESTLLKGLSKASTFGGSFAKKIPLISDTQVDETLLSTGKKISEYGNDKVKKQLQPLTERKENFIRPFIENINTINELYNQPIQIAIDENNLYIGTLQ